MHTFLLADVMVDFNKFLACKHSSLMFLLCDILFISIAVEPQCISGTVKVLSAGIGCQVLKCQT